MQLVFACFLCSSCLRGLRGGRTPYPWIGGCVFTGGKNERDPRPHKLLLPWCHTLQVKPVQHSSMWSILEKHFLSALLFFRVYIQLHKQCKLKTDTCWVDKTLCCFFFISSVCSVPLWPWIISVRELLTQSNPQPALWEKLSTAYAGTLYTHSTVCLLLNALYYPLFCSTSTFWRFAQVLYSDPYLALICLLSQSTYT